MTLNNDDHDLLLKLIQKVDLLCDEFRRVSNGVGFPRCAERQAWMATHERDLATAHKRIDDLKAKIWWASSTSAVAILGFLAQLLLKAIHRA